MLINCSDFLAYTYTVLIFSAGFTKKIASVSSFLPSVPLLSSVKQMSLRTGVRTKPDIWKCYFPNYKKKKKKKNPCIWKDLTGERGVRTMVSTRYYLHFGLFISRKGVCESISGTYEKTSTDGKFLYHKASKLSQRGHPQFSPSLKKMPDILSSLPLCPYSHSSHFSAMSSSLPLNSPLLLSLLLSLSLSSPYPHDPCPTHVHAHQVLVLSDELKTLLNSSDGSEC